MEVETEKYEIQNWWTVINTRHKIDRSSDRKLKTKEFGNENFMRRSQIWKLQKKRKGF